MKKKMLVLLLIILTLTSVVQLAMISHPQTADAKAIPNRSYCCWWEIQNCNGFCRWHWVQVCMNVPIAVCQENNAYGN